MNPSNIVRITLILLVILFLQSPSFSQIQKLKKSEFKELGSFRDTSMSIAFDIGTYEFIGIPVDSSEVVTPYWMLSFVDSRFLTSNLKRIIFRDEQTLPDIRRHIIEIFSNSDPSQGHYSIFLTDKSRYEFRISSRTRSNELFINFTVMDHGDLIGVTNYYNYKQWKSILGIKE